MTRRPPRYTPSGRETRARRQSARDHPRLAPISAQAIAARKAAAEEKAAAAEEAEEEARARAAREADEPVCAPLQAGDFDQGREMRIAESLAIHASGKSPKRV